MSLRARVYAAVRDRARRCPYSCTQPRGPCLPPGRSLGRFRSDDRHWSNALIKLGRIREADEILVRATEYAARYEARGYQAQLVAQRAAISLQQKDVSRALALYEEAVAFARASGGQRLVAEIELERAAVLRAAGQVAAAERVLIDATTIARDMEERFLLPRLLAATADLRASQGRLNDASALLEEASDLLEGLITTASSPSTGTEADRHDVEDRRPTLGRGTGARAPDSWPHSEAQGGPDLTAVRATVHGRPRAREPGQAQWHRAQGTGVQKPPVSDARQETPRRHH